MSVVSHKNFSVQDTSLLLEILQDAQERAKKQQHYQIVSIATEIKQIDPLMFLQAEWQPNHKLFYLEDSLAGSAIGGIGETVALHFSGSERFQVTKLFAKEVLDNTQIIGDTELTFSGPHFFCAFTFFNESISPFPGVSIFLPTYQIARKGGKMSLVVNVKIDIDTDLLELIHRIQATYQKICLFDDKLVTTENVSKKQLQIDDRGGFVAYEKLFRNVLQCIKEGDCQKIVLARAIDVVVDKFLHPLDTLNLLRKNFSNCFPSAYNDGSGHSFISITPERLLKIENNILKTEAVAGTIKRGNEPKENTQLAQQLLKDPKSRQEHRFVVEYILEVLQSMGCRAQYDLEPQLKQLSNMQHLYLPIEATVNENLHPLDIVEKLHPTPAVGIVSNTEAAMHVLKGMEDFDRSLYAGLLGWLNYTGDADFVVGIRSASMHENKARLYAGGGIIEGSEVHAEYNETNLKFQAILNNLC